MKKLVLLMIAAIICFIGYFYASPYITIYKIKKGIIEQDSEKLSENIDFPVLRQNLKEQFNAQMMKKVATELKDNPFGAMGMAIASKLVDGLVDIFVTPSSLAILMEGKKPDRESDTKSIKPTGDKDRKPFRNARYSFDSTNKFSIRVPAENGGEIRFVLTRSGLSWKLSNIVIPFQQQELVKAGTPSIKFEINKWGVQYGYLKVTGKVTNIGNAEAHSLKIRMRIIDTNGVLLGEDTSYPVGYSLSPGQSATIEFHCRISETGNKFYWPPEWSCDYPLAVDDTKAEIEW
jgi:hypothetical protein